MSKDRFYLSNGRYVPSGTTVLPDPDLKKWSAKCAVDYLRNGLEWLAEICNSDIEDEDFAYHIGKSEFKKARTAYQRESMEAADYGTYIHKLCEVCLTDNIKIELPYICPKCRKEFYGHTDPFELCTCRNDNGEPLALIPPHEMTQKFMDGLWLWKTKHNVKVIVMEHEVLSEWYGGRLDLVCGIDSYWMTKAWCKTFGVDWYKGIDKQQVIVLVDFKTGKGSYYDTWKYQLAGYRQAWNSGMFGRNRCSVCPHKDDNMACNQSVCPLIQHHGILKFNKETMKVNYKDFTVWKTTRTNPETLEKEKYLRDYETDRATFNGLVANWWLTKRGIEI